MQNTVQNHRNARGVDETHIRQRLDCARDSFSNSKEGAARAAAYLWLVLDETRRDLGNEWLVKRIQERENEISEDNERLSELKDKVVKHSKGLLKDADYISEE